MDLIAIMGGNIDGIDGDELVLEEDEGSEVLDEGEEDHVQDASDEIGSHS